MMLQQSKTRKICMLDKIYEGNVLKKAFTVDSQEKIKRILIFFFIFVNKLFSFAYFHN